MSRQLEAKWEQQQAKRRQQAGDAVCGGLESAVERAGGELTGVSIKLSGADCLLVVKAVMPGGASVAFVGADDMASAFRKATREALSDSLRWRPDRFATE